VVVKHVNRDRSARRHDGGEFIEIKFDDGL
jgi:hypothetical protein